MPIASGYDYTVRYLDSLEDTVRRSFPAGQAWVDGAGRHDEEEQAMAEESFGDNQAVDELNSSDMLKLGETRHELIERIKRQQRPHPWPSHSEDRTSGRSQSSGQYRNQDKTPHLINPIDIPPHPAPYQDSIEVPSSLAFSIERPRSALHQGDFRGNSSESNNATQLLPKISPTLDNTWPDASPPVSWRPQDAVAIPIQSLIASASSSQAETASPYLPHRGRATSHSLRSTFVFRPPTSPLANLSNSADLDTLEQYMGKAKNNVLGQSSRRRTSSPSSMKALSRPRIDPNALGSFHGFAQKSGREGGSPYQAHQPRRSLASIDDNFASRIVLTSSAHTRRPSLTSESSPLQRLPMVGRYEESILRGRMSSLPSRPLDFVAQIGVLGKGNCRSSLKCPPHVTIPFPAIFYHYGNLPGAISSDGPSPYVGLVDLNKRQCVAEIFQKPSGNIRVSTTDGESTAMNEYWPPSSPKRRSFGGANNVMKDDPSGGYRIPEQGQVQVIIRNPNKTAVKLFLVPYDLRGMTPRQKTFVRQRSYTAGSMLDMPLDSRRNLGTDRPEGALSISDDPRNRPILRYLIHLHICCTARGRYFLYKNIRIVFANRVPDGKEKLQQEIQLPEPRSSPYKMEGSDDMSETCMHRAKPPVSQMSSSTPWDELALNRRNITAHAEQGTPWETRLQETPLTPTMGAVHKNTYGEGHVSTSRTPATNTLIQNESTSPKTTSAIPEVQALSAGVIDSLQLSPAIFEKLNRDDWTPNGTPPRTHSPQAGEGLIAQQYRFWTERRRCSEPRSP